jgi:hypothetical protein
MIKDLIIGLTILNNYATKVTIDDADLLRVTIAGENEPTTTERNLLSSHGWISLNARQEWGIQIPNTQKNMNPNKCAKCGGDTEFVFCWSCIINDLVEREKVRF